MQNKNIIIFDGRCILCNSVASFLSQRLSKEKYTFLSSLSPKGIELLEKFRLGKLAEHTVILIEGENTHIKSDTILKIAKDLPSFWKILVIFKFVPLKIRDSIYDFVSKHRTKFFKKSL